MTEFRVETMSCGHCVAAVTEALRHADPEARIEIDLARKTVRVESARTGAELAEALSQAGYAPA